MYNMKILKLQKINGKGSKKHQQEWKKEIEVYGVQPKRATKLEGKNEFQFIYYVYCFRQLTYIVLGIILYLGVLDIRCFKQPKYG